MSPNHDQPKYYPPDCDTDSEMRHDGCMEDSQTNDLRTALQSVVIAWESLPGGKRHSSHVIEEWLRWAMVNSINKARTVLSDGDLRTDAEKIAELEAVFDMRWNCDMRAIKRWQAATGRDLTWPDQTDLLVWLLEQLDAAEARVAGLMQYEKACLKVTDWCTKHGRSDITSSTELIEAIEAAEARADQLPIQRQRYPVNQSSGRGIR